MEQVQSTNKAGDKKSSKGFSLVMDGTIVGFLTINERLPETTQDAMQLEANMKAVLASGDLVFKPYGQQETGTLDNILAGTTTE